MNSFCICWNPYFFGQTSTRFWNPFLHCPCFMWIVWRNLFLKGFVFNIGLLGLILFILVEERTRMPWFSMNWELIFWCFDPCGATTQKEGEFLNFRHKRILLSLFKLLGGFRKNINRIFSKRVLWVYYVCQRTSHCLFLDFCATFDCGQIE